MNSKPIIWLCLAVGSTLGGALPMLWGDSALSMSSILLGAVGGIAGIWLGFKLSH